MTIRIASSLAVLVLAVAGCFKTPVPNAPLADAAPAAAITAEEARAALLRLNSLRVITGDDDDPIFQDLKVGAVVQEDAATMIGRFIRCDLRGKTWRMSIGVPERHFAAGADGVFEKQAVGSWLAVTKSSHIS